MFIADWWNFVYADLMGRNILLMLLFGWELFITPIVIVLSVVSAVVRTAVTSSTGRD
jgi:hypothetical protein